MSTVAFYSGELMSPEAIRAAYPDALFIARACIPAEGAAIARPFDAVIGDQVWGIAVDLGVELGGDPATVLANARYWELPPAFVTALQSVVQPGQDEE